MKPEERIRTSKFLSLVLRHQPEVIGVRLDEAGWVAVSELLDGCGRHRRPVTLEQLQEIVATNDKKRFEFSPDGSRIRASQGHSVEVELGYSPMVPPEHLYHGNGRAVGAIHPGPRIAETRAASRALVRGRPLADGPRHGRATWPAGGS